MSSIHLPLFRISRPRLLAFVIVLVVGMSGCADRSGPTNPPTGEYRGKIQLGFTGVPSQIVRIQALLTRRGFDTLKLGLAISDTARSATGGFNSVEQGPWHLRVDALDSMAVVRFRGETDLEVRYAETTFVSLRLHPTTADGAIDVVVTWDSSSDCVAPPAGLVAWWPGDNSATDVVGNTPALITGGVSYARGIVGNAFEFDGTGRIALPDLDRFKVTGSFTIEAWVYLRSYATIWGSQILFRGDNRGGYDPYFLCVNSSGYLQIAVSDSYLGEGAQAPFPLHEWVHVAGVFDSASSTARLYKNGELVGAQRIEQHPARDLQPDYLPGLGIGNTQAPGYEEAWDGLIDELSLYNRALTASEIRGIYDAGALGKCRRTRR